MSEIRLEGHMWLAVCDCGEDRLFRTEAAAADWLATHPCYLRTDADT